jgi:hypothetical protein
LQTLKKSAVGGAKAFHFERPCKWQCSFDFRKKIRPEKNRENFRILQSHNRLTVINSKELA